jgi:hypothetical protein
MRQLMRLAAGLGVVVLTCSSVALAAPPPGTSKQACLAAHEEALALKTSKKPHAAHEKLVICARTDCPTIVRKECTEQLEVVEAAAPTVVVEALDDKGNSDTAVKLTLDGNVVGDKLTGAAINVEPGEHVFVFERASDGKKMEEKVLVVEGEKNRKVMADYQSMLPKPVAPLSSPLSPPAGSAEPKKVPTLAYVAGGVALAGFGSFAAFSLIGINKEHSLAASDGCSPHCTDDEIAPVKRDYLIGDISLGIGILATAAALILALPALTSPAPKTAAAPWMPRVRRIR